MPPAPCPHALVCSPAPVTPSLMLATLSGPAFRILGHTAYMQHSALHTPLRNHSGAAPLARWGRSAAAHAVRWLLRLPQAHNPPVPRSPCPLPCLAPSSLSPHRSYRPQHTTYLPLPLDPCTIGSSFLLRFAQCRSKGTRPRRPPGSLCGALHAPDTPHCTTACLSLCLPQGAPGRPQNRHHCTLLESQ